MQFSHLLFYMGVSGFFIYNTVRFLNHVMDQYLFSKKHLIILRGLPGSGKTSYIKHVIEENDVVNYTICSAFYHFKEGLVYKYNPRQLPQAYNSCWKDFLEALDTQSTYIFVNNPNAEKWEYENYIFLGRKFGYTIEIVEIDCPGSGYIDYFQKRSRHNIPIHTVKAIGEKWEDDSCAKIVSCYESD